MSRSGGKRSGGKREGGTKEGGKKEGAGRGAAAEPATSPAAGARGARLRLLFVCTGNTCRSPMAEAIARHEAERRGRPDVEVGSAGTFAYRGEPASELAEIVARRHGLDLGSHRARPLLPELVEDSDIVLGMARSHVEIARELGSGGEVHLLARFLPRGDGAHDTPIPDPVGGSLDLYEETFEILRRAVEGLFDRLEEERPEDG